MTNEQQGWIKRYTKVQEFIIIHQQLNSFRQTMTLKTVMLL